MATFLSYRNHFVYLPLYLYGLLSSLRKLTNHSFYNPDSFPLENQPSLSVWVWLCLQHGAVFVMFLIASFEIRYVLKRRRMPPGDSGWPILGYFVAVMLDTRAFQIRRVQKFGPLSTHSLAGIPVLLIVDDDDIRWAMTQERKGMIRANILPHWAKLIGNESVFLKFGDEHKKLRKIFEPAFSPTAIKDYGKTMDTVVRSQLEKWSSSGEYQEPREWALLAMRVFFVCAFGECDEARMKKLARLFEGWIDGFRALPFRFPGGKLNKAHGYKEEMFAIFREMIDEFKVQHPPPSESNENPQKQHKSVLGRLVYAVDEDGNMPSDEVLMDNLLFFLFAGFDTTKASFGAIFHFLKQHPSAREALVQEIRGYSSEEEIDVDELKFEAPILNAILAETWRLTAPLSGHNTCAAVDLHYKGYVIPKGTFVLTDISAHNVLNEKRYPGASDFHFERWLPEDHPLYDERWANKEEKIDYNVMSHKFRTFNMGQHMCLGGHFAKMETRIVCTRILQNYTIDVRNVKFMRFPLFQISNEFKLHRQR